MTLKPAGMELGLGVGELRSCDGEVTVRSATVGRPEGGMGWSPGF